MQHAETFHVLAEVAVAFAGFASIAVLFRRRDDGEWSQIDALRYRGMLVNSLFSCAFALLPSILGAFGTPSTALWLSCSSLLFAYIAWRLVVSFLSLAYRGMTPLKYSIAAAILLLQLANVIGLPFDRGPASYLAGVSLVLVIAGSNFFELVSVPVPAPRAE
jgi:hypothetical protein